MSFIDVDRDNATCRLSLSIGDIVVRSVPQGVTDHFRDLVANKKFLDSRNISKMFLGDEPVLNIEFHDEDNATAYIFKKVDSGNEKVVEDFRVSKLLSYLDGMLEALKLAIILMGSDVEALINQVNRDIADDVYRVFCDS